MENAAPLDLVVIGAGLGGLATACFAQARGLSVAAVEGEARAGGKLLTLEDDGWLVEHGPLGWLDREPAVAELCGILRLERRVASDAERLRFVAREGRLHPLPLTPWALLRSRLLGLGGKLRVLSEVSAARPAPAHEESIAAFATRRFGPAAAAALFEPVVSAIYAGDPDELSLSACLPLFAKWEREHRSVIRGALAGAKAGAAEPRSGGFPVGGGRLTSLDGGMAGFARAARSALGDALLLGTAVDAVERVGSVAAADPSAGRWCVRAGGCELLARSVALCVPPRAAAQLLADAAPELAAPAAAMRADALVTVTLAYARPARPSWPRFGSVLVPATEGLPLLNVQGTSALFPSTAPEDGVLVRALLGGARWPEFVDQGEDELVEQAATWVGRVLGAAATPARTWCRRVTGGVPQYLLGHGERLAAFESAAERLPGLHFGGEGWHGVGVNAVVRRGRAIVDTMLAEEPAE